jgi:hypothetical protein
MHIIIPILLKSIHPFMHLHMGVYVYIYIYIYISHFQDKSLRLPYANTRLFIATIAEW